MPILELANKLSEVQEKYGTIHYSTHLATFDSESAKRDGVSSDLITLAEESFEYQNELVRGLKTGKYNMVTGPGPSTGPYPKFKKFMERINKRG